MSMVKNILLTLSIVCLCDAQEYVGSFEDNRKSNDETPKSHQSFYNALLELYQLLTTGSFFGASSSDDYYSGINPDATNETLRAELQALISQKTTVSYDGVWTAFKSVDKFLPGYPCSPDPDEIPDIYSAHCWKPQKGIQGGECGNYHKEGDCFNREHSWPKSWFGGFSDGDGAQTDLFELYPSDGYVNSLRANYPLGYVKDGTVTYTSTNGCKLGECASSGYQGTCFEVPDYLKGDLARTYFYLATAYYKVWDCCDEPGVNKWQIKEWMEKDMRAWHAADPVNDQERARNEEIYANHQHNRNPYIDHPEWVSQIADF